MINKVVDRIYVVNLDKDINRLEIISKTMKTLGLTFQRVSGVNGYDIYPDFKDQTTLRPGQLGCLLSHQWIIKDAISNKYQNICVLEDDIVFHKQFLKLFKKKFKSLTKTTNKKIDLLYLGCSQKHKWKNIIFNQHYITGNMFFGTFGMIINKKMFDPILQHSSLLKYPIDEVLVKLQKRFHTYCLYPYLITVHPHSHSNTTPTTNNVLTDQNLCVNPKYYEKNRLSLSDFFVYPINQM